MLKRKVWALILGSLLGATLASVPATASPGGGNGGAEPSAAPAYMTKPMSQLTQQELRLRLDAEVAKASAKKNAGVPYGPPGESTQGFLSQSGGTVSWTSVTVGWNKGTIRIDGYLYAPDNSLVGQDGYTCLRSTSCTYPTHYTGCTCIHGTWQLYTYTSGPGGSGSDAHRADLVT